MKPMRSMTADMGNAWRAGARAEWLAAWRVREVPAAAGVLTCVDAGTGPPLVLLPPLPGFKEAFAPCAHLLVRTFRVIAPDLRARFPGGLAQSARWSLLVRDLEHLCDALGLERVAVAGHSLGGALAQHWALERPDRIRALVLSSAFARVTTPRGARLARYVEQPLVIGSQRLLPRGAALAIARRLAPRGGWVYDPLCDRPVLELVRAAIRACPVRLAAGRVTLALAHDTHTRLAALRPPVRLLVGERDTAFARAAAQALVRSLPAAKIEVSPGAGHLHPLSRPAWFAGRIAAFAAAHP